MPLITAVCQYCKTEFEYDPDFEFGKTNKSAEFLADFPFGMVPTANTPDGPLYETDAICYYIAAKADNKTLLGNTTYEEALVQQYIHVSNIHIQPIFDGIIKPIWGYAEYNADVHVKSKADLLRILAIFNGIFKSKTYLIGDKVSLADIKVFGSFYHLMCMIVDAESRKAFPHFLNWFNSCAEQPEFIAAYGKTVLCEKEQLYVEKKNK